MIVASLALGAVIGLVMGALGGGGSVLTVPVLVFVLGLSAPAATSSSLVIVGVTAAVAALGHALARRVRWRVAGILVVFGVPTSVLGSRLNGRVDEDVLLLAFAGLLVVAAAGMLLHGEAEASADPAAGGTEPVRVRTAPLAAAGLAVGLITGFLGVGGGFVVVPVLVALIGFPMPVAAATSLVVIALNAGVALLARASLDGVDSSIVVPFTLAAVAGSLVAGRVAGRVRADRLTRGFAALLVATAVYVATEAVLGLT